MIPRGIDLRKDTLRTLNRDLPGRVVGMQRRKTSSPLVSLIRDRLKALGLNFDDLEDFMRSRGFNFGAPYLDTFARPEDLRMIADFIKASPSQLLEMTEFADEFAFAVFEENWDQYKHRIDSTFDDSWRRVLKSVEFRGQVRRSIRREIELVVQALVRPKSSASPCLLPDCDCILRCKITGIQMGAEG